MTQKLLELGITARSTVVDIGFGQADELRVMAGIVGDEGKVYGIEQSEVRVQDASKELRGVQNITVMTGNVFRVPPPDRLADYVLLKGVLHEVPSVSKALVEVARVCRLQGAVLIVDFTSFPRPWLTESNLKWRLGSPRRLLSGSLDRHPIF